MAEKIRLELDFGSSVVDTAKLQEELKSLGDRGPALEKLFKSVEKSIDNAGKSTINWGRSVYIASQGLEDLQYGIGGVLNNIPMLVTSLGGGLGLAAGISVVSVGINQLIKHWGDLSALFGGEANQIPILTNSLEGVEDRLKKINDQLEKYRKQQSLTNEQLADYNKLSEEQIKLEDKKLAFEQERKRLKAFEELGPAEEKEDKEKAAKIISEAIGGRQGQLTGPVAEQLMADWLKEREGEYAELKKRYLEADLYERTQMLRPLMRLKESIDKVRRGEFAKFFQQNAESLVAASVAGRKDAIAVISGMQQRTPEAFAEIDRMAFEAAMPEGLRAKEQEKIFIERQQRMARLDKDLKEKQRRVDEKEEREAMERNKAEVRRANAVWDNQIREEEKQIVENRKKKEKQIEDARKKGIPFIEGHPAGPAFLGGAVPQGPQFGLFPIGGVPGTAMPVPEWRAPVAAQGPRLPSDIARIHRTRAIRVAKSERRRKRLEARRQARENRLIALREAREVAAGFHPAAAGPRPGEGLRPAQEALGANQATLNAMNQALIADAALEAQAKMQEKMAKQMEKQFEAMAARLQGWQAPAQQWGRFP